MKNTLMVVGIVLIVLLVLSLIGEVGMMGGYGGYAGYQGYPGMMTGMMSGYGVRPLAAVVALAGRILFLVGLVILAVWLVRNANRGDLHSGSRESPLDILKARYAKGEITKEQFDSIKRDLGA